MELNRLGLKVYLEGAEKPDLLAFIPVFHRWIQSRATEDMLVDVADYSHVHQGPGILLVAHEGNYGLDETGGERGLVYYSKRELEGSLAARLERVARRTLTACRLLEQDPEVGAQLAFRGDALQVFANDRLLAPNEPGTLDAFKPALSGLLERLWDGADYTLNREPDPRERFAVTARCARPSTVATLLERLDGA